MFKPYAPQSMKAPAIHGIAISVPTLFPALHPAFRITPKPSHVTGHLAANTTNRHSLNNHLPVAFKLAFFQKEIDIGGKPK